MNRSYRSARVNVRLLVTLLAGAILLAGAAFGVHRLRKQIIASRALESGRAAFKKQDWPEATKQLRLYLSKYPDDPEILALYADALLNTRPLETDLIGAAVSAYRRLVRLDPRNESAFKRLSNIYGGTQSFAELAHIAGKRLEAVPDDARASLWLAAAQNGQRKYDDARKTLTALVERLEREKKLTPEYTEACGLMCEIVLLDRTDTDHRQALKWLDRAVEHAPASPGAFVQRASVRRILAAEKNEKRDATLAAVRGDLERADSMELADPRLRLRLGTEWLELGQLDRAAAELEAAKAAHPEAVREFFLDSDDWVAARYVLAAEIASRKEDGSGAAKLADEVLGQLKYRRQRLSVLPVAIRAYLTASRPADGRRLLDEYVAALPKTERAPELDEQVATLEALVSLAENRPYRAIDVLEPVVSKSAARPAIWRLLADAYARTGQDRRTAYALTQSMDPQRPDRDTLLRLTKAYLAQQNWVKAGEAARIAASVDTNSLEARLLRIEAQLSQLGANARLRQPAALDAIGKELDGYAAAVPNIPAISLLQARVEGLKGHLDRAVEIAKGAIRKGPDSLHEELQLVRIYTESQRQAEAIVACRTACENHPESFAAWRSLADLQQSAGQYAEATQTLLSAEKSVVDPRQKIGLVLLRLMLELQHGNRETAIRSLKELAAANPGDIQVRTTLLQLPEVNTDAAASQKLLQEIQQVEGERGLTWRYIQAATLLAGAGWREKQGEIADGLTRCVEADPEWSAPARLLGTLQERLGNLEAAETIYRRAIAANPSALDVVDNLVKMLLAQRRYHDVGEVLAGYAGAEGTIGRQRTAIALGSGDLAGAVREMKLQAERDPKDAATRVLLASVLYRQTRDAKQAISYLDQAESLGADADFLTWARADILVGEGRYDEARRLLDARVEKSPNFESLLLRAQFFASRGETDLADRDYLKLTTLPKAENAYELLGRHYQATNRLDQAIAAWEKGLAEDPARTALARLLIQALLTRNGPQDRSRVSALLAAMEAKNPRDPANATLRAGVLLADGSPEAARQARELLEQTVKSDPAQVEACVGLVDISMKAGDLAGARSWAERAQKVNPKDPRVLLARAAVERASRNLGVACDLAEEVLKNDPLNSGARAFLIETLVGSPGMKSLERARDLVSEAVQQEPNDVRFQLMQALVLHALKQTGPATEKLEAFARTPAGSKNSDVLITLADLCRAQNDWPRSLAWIDKAAAIAPDAPSVLKARVAWLGEQQKWDELDQLVAAARARIVGNVEVLTVVADMYMRSGSAPLLKKVHGLYETAMTALPQSIEVQLGLASTSYRLGEVAEAEKLYRRVLEARPMEVSALNDLAWLLAESKHDYPAALELAEKAVRLAPNDANILDTRAFVLSNMPNRVDDARKDYERCIELIPDASAPRARSLLRLARLCARLKDGGCTARAIDEAGRIDEKQRVFTPEERAEIDSLRRSQAPAGKPTT